VGIRQYVGYDNGLHHNAVCDIVYRRKLVSLGAYECKSRL
uniref:Uncharacterized protein n=1 Tax=Ciona intestinalis TaxID=7719 RepID=H2XZE1_CIOIN